MMQQAHDLAKKHIEVTINKRCDKFNSKKTRREFQLGDLVNLNSPAISGKNVAKKFQNKYTGPYRIIEKKGPVTFKIKKLGATSEKMAHAERLKLYEVGNNKITIENKLKESTKEHEKVRTESESDSEDFRLEPDEADDFLEMGRELMPNQTENVNDFETDELSKPRDEESDSGDSHPSDNHDDDDSDGEEFNSAHETSMEDVRRTRTRVVKIPAKFKDFVLD